MKAQLNLFLLDLESEKIIVLLQVIGTANILGKIALRRSREIREKLIFFVVLSQCFLRDR